MLVAGCWLLGKHKNAKQMLINRSFDYCFGYFRDSIDVYIDICICIYIKRDRICNAIQQYGDVNRSSDAVSPDECGMEQVDDRNSYCETAGGTCMSVTIQHKSIDASISIYQYIPACQYGLLLLQLPCLIGTLTPILQN